MSIKTILSIIIISLFITACNKKDTEPRTTGCDATYTENIRPLVNAKCSTSGCHDGSNILPDFSTYTPLKERADNGRLQDLVLNSGIMPPASATQLTEHEKETFKCWLDNGAPE